MPPARPRFRRPRNASRLLATLLAAGGLIPSSLQALALGATGVPAHRPSAPSPSARANGAGRVQVLRLREPGSGHVHPVWVYRPDVADSSSLPVLYFLHGVPGGPRDVFAAGLAGSLDRLFARGAAPFVVVAPDGNTSRSDSEWADWSDGRDLLESFVTRTVVSAVEGHHPRDRAHRAIAGFSMGAYGAVNVAEHHPALFGQVVSIAGYFDVDDPDGAFADNASLVARNSPDRHGQALSATRVMLLDAQGERLRVIRGQSTRMYRLLRGAGVHATLSIAPGVHDWRFVASQFPVLERFLESGWPSGAAVS